jgi:capsular exopolysaccharide synthesis family protein
VKFFKGKKQNRGSEGQSAFLGTDKDSAGQRPGDKHKTEDVFGIITTEKPGFFEADQFRVLRTKLFFPASGKRPRSIAVTGAEVGEGKSFIAANLAVCAAQNVDDRQTLLIDCDMRLPTIHRMFGFEDGPGLSDYLSGEIPLSAVLRKPPADKLTILPGGRLPDNPSELLSSAKMSLLLQEVQSRYEDRYIIIDLPSPRLIAEAELIVRQVDCVIIVVSYGQTLTSHVNELIDIIGKDRISGIVFNRFDTSMHSSLYRMYKKFIRRK